MMKSVSAEFGWKTIFNYQSKIGGTKKIRKQVLLIGAFFLIMSLSGSCVARLGTFTVLSTKNIDWSRANEYIRNSLNRRTGRDIAHIIIFIPTQWQPTIEDAVDKAIEQVTGGVALVDAVVGFRSWYIPFYGQDGFTVEGTVLVDPILTNNDEQANYDNTTYYYAHVVKGEIKTEIVTKEAFNRLGSGK